MTIAALAAALALLALQDGAPPAPGADPGPLLRLEMHGPAVVVSKLRPTNVGALLSSAAGRWAFRVFW